MLLLNVYPALNAASSTVGNVNVKLTAVFILVYSGIIVSTVGGLVPSVIHVPSFVMIVTSFIALLRVVVRTCIPTLCTALNLFVPLVIMGYVMLKHTRTFTTGGGPITSLFSNLNVNLNFAVTLALLNTIHRFLKANGVFGLDVLPRRCNVLMFILTPNTFVTLNCLVTLVGDVGGGWW